MSDKKERRGRKRKQPEEKILCQVDACAEECHAKITDCVHSSCNNCSLIEVKDNSDPLKNGFWRKCPFCSRVEKVSQEYIDKYIDTNQTIAQGCFDSEGKLGRIVPSNIVMTRADFLQVGSSSTTTSTTTTEDNDDNIHSSLPSGGDVVNEAENVRNQDILYYERLSRQYRHRGVSTMRFTSAWDFPCSRFSPEGREYTVEEAFERNLLPEEWMFMLNDHRKRSTRERQCGNPLMEIPSNFSVLPFLYPADQRNYTGSLDLRRMFDENDSTPVFVRYSGFYRTVEGGDSYRIFVKRAYDAGILPDWIQMIIGRQLNKEANELASLPNSNN